MPFEQPIVRRIAIIGAGVSGLSAAYQLARDNDVTVFESSPNIGGHARTVMAGKRGDVPVDTGFIVFNYATYPHLTKMFEALNVPVKPSCMSFGVSIGNGAVEYGSRSINALLAQRGNIAKTGFWRMLNDIRRFNKYAPALAQDHNMTVLELIDQMQMGKWFRDYYLLPFCGAIWSSTPHQMAEFPAKTLLQFLENHALLSPFDLHKWYTVDGGSAQYLYRISDAIKKHGGKIRTNAAIENVTRGPLGAIIRGAGGEEHFDDVIFACHSDQALRILGDPTQSERQILGDIKYQNNTAILHKDTQQMPKRKSVWSSWVYRDDGGAQNSKVGITYWMNQLQGIAHDDPLFVSLNPARDIADEMIYDQTTFAHPVFDRNAIRAQQMLPAIQGHNNTWYCGAWTRYGFHEDGYASAVSVAERLRSGQMVS